MFRFESLEVYDLAKRFSLKIRGIINSRKFDLITKDQLRRASLSVVLNLAEGSGRFSEKDIRRFYVISRGSLFECIAILDILNTENVIKNEEHKLLLKEGELISKKLYGMIKKGK